MEAKQSDRSSEAARGSGVEKLLSTQKEREKILFMYLS